MLFSSSRAIAPILINHSRHFWFPELSRFKTHNNLFKRSTIIISVFVYIATLLLILLSTEFAKIGIYRKITITWFTLLPCYLCSVAGSVLIIKLGKLLDKSQILEYVGKNSILFYLLHRPFLKLFFDVYRSMFGVSTSMTIIGFFTVFLITNIIVAIVSKVMNTRYLSYLIGKF